MTLGTSSISCQEEQEGDEYDEEEGEGNQMRSLMKHSAHQVR